MTHPTETPPGAASPTPPSLAGLRVRYKATAHIFRIVEDSGGEFVRIADFETYFELSRAWILSYCEPIDDQGAVIPWPNSWPISSAAQEPASSEELAVTSTASVEAGHAGGPRT